MGGKMKYIALFNEIQLSRDYYEDPQTGVNWRYHIDDEAKRVYIEFQETKTDKDFKDWFYNLLVIPKTIEENNKKITVPLGFYLQANAASTYICADYTRGKLPNLARGYNYAWYFCGWSLGGAVAGITGFLLQNILANERHLIHYGTPAYCFNKKSLNNLCNSFATVKDFLYKNDWIKPLVPLCKRPPSIDVQPSNPDDPQTLDQQHRVYGHCIYSAPDSF